MAFNVGNLPPSVITVFGGLVTQTPPWNLPEGTSPDNQDVVFWPGAVAGRPTLVSALSPSFGAVTATWAKTFVDPTGLAHNLYLDSSGKLYVETTIGIYVQLQWNGSPAVVTPGSYAKSVTAFGREFIAISDKLHGSDVALQYDPQFGLSRVTTDGPGTSPVIANSIIAPVAGSAGPTLTRVSNVVTASTAAAHNLKVGYLAQITGISAQPVGFLSTIKINNEDNPGIATVTMATPHGLSPGIFVSIQNPPGTVVGTAVNGASLVGNVLTVSTSAVNGLAPGAVVTITLTGGTASSALAAPFTATVVVDSINTTEQFVCTIPNSNAVNATATGGTVTLNWPSSGNPETTFWEVLECPSDTIFTVALSYSDGTWTGSSTGVFEPWDGTFYVVSVPSSTTFTYSSQGPDGNSGSDVGLITPSGQAAPGTHQMQVLFQTFEGYVTTGSPPVKFVANGGQYLHVTDIPVGPSLTTAARILAFTGAEGGYFFYIPVPSQVDGQVVSTATQINDNTTTSIVLDFSDRSLFAGLAINTPGNNIPAQITLDGALGFGFFSSRLITWGQRNCVNNLLNMSFDGGSCSAAPITGWSGSGSLTAGHFSEGVSSPNLSQSFYEDAYGAPIGEPNQSYLARAWMTGTCTVTITSASTGFSSTASLTAGVGGWGQAAFNTDMPPTIPSDMLLTVTGSGVVDHLSIIFAAEPFLDTEIQGSYVNNPEAFDGVTGPFGASDDSHKVMDFGIIRETMYFLTQDPGGRVHAVENNGVTEPVGWPSREVAANCGLMSAFALTKSQADDSSASGGEEWMAWASVTGARIFGGDQPWKITQEIQPDWSNINPSALLTVWALNDPAQRVMYFGLPIGTNTAPSLVYPMNYRELDSAFQIAQSAPIHTSFSGKLIATDHVRKWTRWNLPINYGALVYRGPGLVLPLFCGGNGATPGTGGFGNVYTITGTGLSDADYGQMYPYYVTYFFVGADAEMGLHLGAQRKILSFLQFLMTGQTGTHVTVSIFSNQLTNQWPIQFNRNLDPQQNYDLEVPGGSAVGQRFAFKFQVFPGTV